VLVSEGSVEANRAFGLRSRILLDEALATRRAYGAAGTPSAVLVDSDRVISSDLVTGGNAVLELIAYVDCQRCLEECRKRGGGEACLPVCQAGGQCPWGGKDAST
jgi:hypothetical protein